MSEMVEKVAEAIWKAESLRAASKPRSVSWQDLGEEAQSKYLPVARAAIEAMREPTEKQLDAVRHIVQWHTFERPTEAALIRHAGCLRKAVPDECMDVEHVPPTNMVSYWIHRGIIDAALKD